MPMEDDRVASSKEGGRADWKKNLTLLLYVVLVIVFGTTNRVTFKYSMINYSYFTAQMTTFIYLAISFVVILLKFAFTNHITTEMVVFPKWKFWVMGLIDSIQGFLFVVGGLHVPGIMQNLLLQGAVPVTMFFSLLMLRNTGDSVTRGVRNVLLKKSIKFTERKATEVELADAELMGTSVCKIFVNGRDIGDVTKLLGDGELPDDDVLVNFFKWIIRLPVALGCWKNKKKKKTDEDSLMDDDSIESFALFGGLSLNGSEKMKNIVLVSDANSWYQHFASFYSVTQYLGAIIILSGLVVSVWPDLIGGGGDNTGPIASDILFFSATIPIAVSAIYKEIAFNSVKDMDVWLLNGYVSLPQFLIGLIYAPLAAVMTGIEVQDIPSNLWQGYQCWAVGTNFISREEGYDCSVDLDCGSPGHKICCDSCNGIYPNVSSIPALWGILGYVLANIAYNVGMMLVIKHGSASLLYASCTLILPFGSIAFTVPAFLGQHAKSFSIFTGVGLGVVLLGLIVYRLTVCTSK